MRYEKKFRVYRSQFLDIVNILHKLSFKKHHEDRFISSIYYDTSDFKLYRDSIEGISIRKKIRLRYYNGIFDEINIEKKIKYGDLGFKIISPLSKKKHYKLTNLLKKSIYNQKIINQKILIPSHIENSYFPVSLVQYLRKYYISNDKKIRVTLDEKINYSRIFKNKENYTLNNNISDKVGVIEIKFEENEVFSKKLLHKLTTFLNCNLSRNSKYCNSIELLF